jgi:hypothetical protein
MWNTSGMRKICCLLLSIIVTACHSRVCTKPEKIISDSDGFGVAGAAIGLSIYGGVGALAGGLLFDGSNNDVIVCTERGRDRTLYELMHDKKYPYTVPKN